MDWEKFVRKYVWDEEKTPYHVRVEHMNRRQADSEVYLYALFVAIAFAFASLRKLGLAEDAFGQLAGLYSMSVAAVACLLGFTKHVAAALYVLTAPLCLFVYLQIAGFPPTLSTVDHYVLYGFTLLWLLYAVRVVAIARAYPRMPAPDRPPGS